MNLYNLKINFLGDSITQGVGAGCQEHIFLNLLSKNVGLAEARNYGISGTGYAIQKGTKSRPKDSYVDVNSFSERFDQMEDDADIVVFLEELMIMATETLPLVVSRIILRILFTVHVIICIPD